jgi:riboflavin synthase
MFTGIVSDVGEVLAVERRAEGLARLTIACTYERDSIALGASISCAGVCLTVVATDLAGNRTAFSVDAAAETLGMTTASRWTVGTRLNLERALKMGDELGGHLVAGHVDGIADIIGREDLPDMARLTVRAPSSLGRFIAPKARSRSMACRSPSSTLIIPHTLEVTTLGGIKKGDPINLEVDLMARYAARLMSAGA